MAKVTISVITSGYAPIATLNANFQALADAIENTLSRDGTSPNTMSADLDMNSNRILNLPEPINASEAARLADVTAAIAGNSAANLVSFTPAGNIAATTVQGAIEELDSEKLAASAVSAFGLTLIDDTTAAAARTTLGALGSTEAPGAPYVDTNPVVIGGTDATKKLRFEVDGFTTGNTRVVTFPDANLTLPDVTAAGDIVQASGSGVLARLAIGTAGQVLAVNAGATAVAYQAMATQADQESATSVIAPVTPGRQQFHPSALKAWLAWKWSGGAPTAQEARLVSSLTDTGTGIVTVNFSTAFAAATFCTTTGFQTMDSSTQQQISISTQATGSVRATYFNAGVAADNTNICSIMCAGDH